METLLDLLPRMRELGDREALRYSNGLRTWTLSYDELYARIGTVARFLDDSKLRRHDRLILWCENRPEWVSVFWAALSRGIELVPLDVQTRADRVRRIVDEVEARLVIRGTRTASDILEVATLPVDQIADLPAAARFEPDPAEPDDVVEILYTSGTTADPKGVIHRHRNIAANLTPVAREIRKYRRWAQPFQPIRILDMLPFSHMFGQSMGLFVPPVLGGSVVLLTEMHPGALGRRIRRERVSVLVAVPRLLKSLESDLRRRYPWVDSTEVSGGVLWRFWRYRAIHRDFGWKFWALVVGGAELPRATEDFWLRIGFAVVQGYGLTETSPVVAVNHPFHARRGTLGKALGAQEIRIAEDGEILVRGPSIVSEYLGSGAVRKKVTDSEGWFHTGDIGSLDTAGQLVFRGRKKDVIVLPDGFNVHPEDVERALQKVAGVRDSAVVPAPAPEGDRVHAALILDPESRSPASIIEDANRVLEPQQRIRSWSLWPEPEFPKTASTMKVQRHIVAARILGGSADLPSPAPSGGRDIRQILAEMTGRPVAEFTERMKLGEELGLSSLERVDVQALVEERYGIELDEADFSELSTVGELEAHVQGGPPGGREATGTRPADGRGPRRLSVPRWTRWLPIRALRALVQAALVQPILAPWVRLEVAGLENLRSSAPPVIFASTHQSHLDVPVILRGLPRQWRRRLAPAMSQEYFFGSSGWVTSRRAFEYYLVLGAFNAYPLPQRPGQIRDALEYTGELVTAGYCPLVFPEGRRSADDSIETFRAGVGFMSGHLKVPVIPVRLHGLSAIFPVGAKWPRRGSARLVFGPALYPRAGEAYPEFASRLADSVRSLV